MTVDDGDPAGCAQAIWHLQTLLMDDLQKNQMKNAKKPNITEKSPGEFSIFLYKNERKRYNRKVNDMVNESENTGKTSRNQQNR